MKVLLAVSGGIDSMCMADMFVRAGGDCAVAHCNFHLRGADSDADADLVERWAKAQGLRFFRADFDTAAYASEHGISIEMAARELRYAWFAQVAAENGFDAVAVAHNANDNAETLILNLLRGTGLRGITGMASERPFPGTIKLIRPLLGMSRDDIVAYVTKYGVEYREDRTNAENDAHRNRIRNEVFPEFAKINPSFVRTLNADMKHFAQADAIVEDYFREAEAKIMSGNGTILADELLALKHWQYVFFRIAEPCGFSAGTLDAALALLTERAEGRGTFAGKRFLSPTHVLETSSKGFTVRPRSDGAPEDGAVTVDGPGTYSLRGRTVRIELLPHIPGTMLKQPAGTLICDAGALPFPFTLRGWRAGDWMRPFGMGGKAKKISDLFTDNKLSLTDKELAVVVYSPALDRDVDGHVAAVAGLRMDEALRVAKGSVQIVRITEL